MSIATNHVLGAWSYFQWFSLYECKLDSESHLLVVRESWMSGIKLRSLNIIMLVSTTWAVSLIPWEILFMQLLACDFTAISPMTHNMWKIKVVKQLKTLLSDFLSFKFFLKLNLSVLEILDPPFLTVFSLSVSTAHQEPLNTWVTFSATFLSKEVKRVRFWNYLFFLLTTSLTIEHHKIQDFGEWFLFK